MKKIIKRSLLISCIALALIVIVSCKKETTNNYASSTVVGQITSIKDSTVNLTLGEFDTNSDMKPDGSAMTPPDGSAMTPPDGSAMTPPDGSAMTPPDGSAMTPPDGSAMTPPDEGTMTPPDEDGMMAGGNKEQKFTLGTVKISVNLSNVQITGNNQTISVSDLKVGDILSISFDANSSPKTVRLMNMSGNNNNDNQNVDQGTASNTIDTDSTISDTTYSSTADNDNALRLEKATIYLTNVKVEKLSGDSSNTENGDFYGVNAGVLATNGANVTIKNSEITTSVKNGNGIFSYGSSTTVTIIDTTITTTGNSSGGIQTTGGGTTIANNLNVTTSGNSSATIRSDRGGGTVTVDGGTYITNGYNSPAVYSTANISVKNATLVANNSEALVIEGKNTIHLENSQVSGNMSDTLGSSSKINVHNIMLYQSMSGDAEVGMSTLEIIGGTITSNNGDMIYVTNTTSTILLKNVELINVDEEEYFLRIAGNDATNGWGTVGKNGGSVTLTLDAQTVNGNISVDTISTLDLSLTNNSTFTGSINIVENQDGTEVSDNAMVVIEEGSVWNLTGNSTVSSLTNSGTINFNGYTITLANGTVLSGN